MKCTAMEALLGSVLSQVLPHAIPYRTAPALPPWVLIVVGIQKVSSPIMAVAWVLTHADGDVHGNQMFRGLGDA